MNLTADLRAARGESWADKLERIRARCLRAWMSWTDDEDIQLAAEFDAGFTVDQLAIGHGRRKKCRHRLSRETSIRRTWNQRSGDQQPLTNICGPLFRATKHHPDALARVLAESNTRTNNSVARHSTPCPHPFLSASRLLQSELKRPHIFSLHSFRNLSPGHKGGKAAPPNLDLEANK